MGAPDLSSPKKKAVGGVQRHCNEDCSNVFIEVAVFLIQV